MTTAGKCAASVNRMFFVLPGLSCAKKRVRDVVLENLTLLKRIWSDAVPLRAFNHQFGQAACRLLALSLGRLAEETGFTNSKRGAEIAQ